ncbi:hypothetical protein KDA_47750 [Dictyobacter alpinus]|uniref:Winged helix-turn helix domain-containing protein n=1 Tax=Dictyobacter alpinus TaxID=2014873 RepID=A0A402BD18_9CHLR|nr:helix-turn-helix domain-containing protein [Dictyobacter alpinus]GCE29291.1 hypothetical protein KDA_47750 [Dictyobacter alpinus]
MAHPVSEVLRPLTQEKRSELQCVKHASSEPHLRHQRTVALLAMAEGASHIKAAQQAGWSTLAPVRKLVGRFTEQGLGTLNDPPRRGRAVRYGAAKKARILQEACRTPDRAEDATANWSLSLPQQALRKAPDGLPQVSTFTILLPCTRQAIAGRRAVPGAIPAER